MIRPPLSVSGIREACFFLELAPGSISLSLYESEYAAGGDFADFSTILVLSWFVWCIPSSFPRLVTSSLFSRLLQVFSLPSCTLFCALFVKSPVFYYRLSWVSINCLFSREIGRSGLVPPPFSRCMGCSLVTFGPILVLSWSALCIPCLPVLGG